MLDEHLGAVGVDEPIAAATGPPPATPVGRGVVGVPSNDWERFSVRNASRLRELPDGGATAASR